MDISLAKLTSSYCGTYVEIILLNKIRFFSKGARKVMESQLIQRFIEFHKLPAEYEKVALKWFTPVSELINRHQKGAVSTADTYFVGLNGCQGSGKSTLTDLIKTYCEEVHGLKVAVISLDDFYLPQDRRQRLAIDVHPLLKTRGVPGTHDVELMEQVLTSLKNGETGFSLPRFNKAIDNPFPQQEWPVVNEKMDLVIFEGWCWGTKPQTSNDLASPVNELENSEDEAGSWRTFVNTQLKDHYQPLYEFIDFWILLKAPSFDCVFEWRKQQEHKLAESNPDDTSGVMSDAEVYRFIQHYQRLTEQTFTQSDEQFDVIYQMDDKRQILSVTGLETAES